jgi:hypothetical protein
MLIIVHTVMTALTPSPISPSVFGPLSCSLVQRKPFLPFRRKATRPAVGPPGFPRFPRSITHSSTLPLLTLSLLLTLLSLTRPAATFFPADGHCDFVFYSVLPNPLPFFSSSSSSSSSRSSSLQFNLPFLARRRRLPSRRRQQGGHQSIHK